MNRANREFTYYPGFIDRTLVSPKLCIQACSSLKYPYAAIESGQLCLCKQSGIIDSTLAAGNNCEKYTCPGDSALFCGSDTHILVYEIEQKTTVSKIKIYTKLKYIECSKGNNCKQSDINHKVCSKYDCFI